MKNDLQDLCKFVSNSSSDGDYVIRFNFLLSVFISEFEIDIAKNDFLPFFTYELVNEYNSTFNSIVNKLNAKNSYESVLLKKDIFLLILEQDFTEHYKLWLCKGESALN
jgi:hypothetical protein